MARLERAPGPRAIDQFCDYPGASGPTIFLGCPSVAQDYALARQAQLEVMATRFGRRQDKGRLNIDEVDSAGQGA